MAMSLPPRTAATMPHPHEQKLQDVVNSLTSESLRDRVLARTAGTSMRLLKASPAQPLVAFFIHSLRDSRPTFLDDGRGSFFTPSRCPFTSLLFAFVAICSPVRCTAWPPVVNHRNVNSPFGKGICQY